MARESDSVQSCSLIRVLWQGYLASLSDGTRRARDARSIMSALARFHSEVRLRRAAASGQAGVRRGQDCEGGFSSSLIRRRSDSLSRQWARFAIRGVKWLYELER